jgi:hypothetical protein
VWAHPDLLPDSSDLDSPDAFVERVLGGGDGGDFDNPMAQLEATEARERAEEAERGKSGKDDESES